MPTEMEHMTEKQLHITQPQWSLPRKLACMFLIWWHYTVVSTSLIDGCLFFLLFFFFLTIFALTPDWMLIWPVKKDQRVVCPCAMSSLDCRHLHYHVLNSSLTWRSWYLDNSSTLSFWSCVGGRCRRRRWRADMPPAPETWWWSGSCLPWGVASPRGGRGIWTKKVKVICFINLSNETLKHVASFH